MAGWGSAVKAMRVMSRLSGYWQGSQGKARSDKVKHGRVRFGSRGELIYVKACQDKAVKVRFVRAW